MSRGTPAEYWRLWVPLMMILAPKKVVMHRLMVILLIAFCIFIGCTTNQVQKNLQKFYAPYTGLEEPNYIPGGPTINEQAVQLEKLRVARERKYGLIIKDRRYLAGAAD